ncbi:gamma-aminobutyric acid receptor subunit beta-like, partial [Lingula anatina]
DYTITLYLNQYWRDERLQFSNADEYMTLTGDFAEKIWVPDTFFANDKNSFLHEVTEKNKMVRLYGDGSIAYGMRFTTTLACMMDLHYYPLDEQNCTIEMESYGYAMQDVVMYWKAGKDSVKGVEHVELPQFSIVEYRTISTVQYLATGDYQRLSLSFLLQRNIGYFIFQTYLPSILIVMLSWVSFWINHEATSARVALGITTVLTMTTISTGVRSSLPRISYVKAIDIYLVMCFVFVFAALLEYAAVNYTYWGARAKKKAKKAKQEQELQQQKVNGFRTSADEDESIEMQDPRMSPILSLRNRQSCCYENEQTMSTAPVRMTTCLPRGSYGYQGRVQRQSSARRRTSSIRSSFKSGKRIVTGIREKAKTITKKVPTVKDVNNIDKYSRLVFPTLFLIFNVGYWCFYLLA